MPKKKCNNAVKRGTVQCHACVDVLALNFKHCRDHIVCVCFLRKRNEQGDPKCASKSAIVSGKV